MQQPLFDAGQPDYAGLYDKLGIDPKAYSHPADIKRGLPGQSENTTVGFFCKLGVGIVLPTGALLKIERRNQADPFDIDFHILKDGQPIAFIDNEHRSNDFPFFHPGAPLNVPLNSRKVEYYFKMPERCFYLARRSNMNSAICCHAKDFIHLEPKPHHTFFGGRLVWQAPRKLTCFGNINDHTIEDWVLWKLDKEGLLC